MSPKEKAEIKTASIRMPKESWELLNKLCELQKRTQGAVIELWIEKDAKKAGLIPDKK